MQLIYTEMYYPYLTPFIHISTSHLYMNFYYKDIGFKNIYTFFLTND